MLTCHWDLTNNWPRFALAAPRKCSLDSHDERRNRSRNDNPSLTRNENLYCVIQSWLSAWVVRDFISHSLRSVVAWFVIGDCLPSSKEKKSDNWSFRRIYIWICSKGFDERRGFIFFPRKLYHCIWRDKHDLIYHRKGIPVNMILLSLSAHFMADARRNTFFSALNIPLESEHATKRNIQL